MAVISKVVPLALAIAACGGSGVPAGNSSEDNASQTANAATAGPASKAPALPPWKSEADCYWVLTHPDGVAHRASIGANQDGLFLNIFDQSIHSLPVSDDLAVSLVRDGDAQRPLRARGSHGDEDGSSLLTVILDDPQRALIAGAREVGVTAERQSFVLPMVGAPDKAALDACVTEGQAGEFTEQ